MGLPDTGRDRDDLLAEMADRREGDADWRSGRAWSLVYHAGEDVEDLRNEAYRRFASENALNPAAFPSVLSFENEVVGMVADLMHGETAVGNVTSGGTESILLSVYAARERARGEGVTDPAIVFPETAHPAWAKAAHYFGLEPVMTETREDWRADPAAVAAAVDKRTALVVASAPSYPHGVVDPVSEIASAAAEAAVPCHVDACIGGFVLPFLEDRGQDIPPFDFRVPGVSSISVDPHKYGYTAKGVSTLLYRDKSLRRDQYFAYDGWPGGVYVAPNLQGTRPAGPIAAAWAVLRFVGRDGYRELVAETLDATATVTAAVESIPELGVVSDPDMTLLAIESTSEDVNAWTVHRELTDRGWRVGRQQRPRSLHLSVMAQHVPVVEAFIADLETAVAVARSADTADATAPMYGMSGDVADHEDIEARLLETLNDVYVPPER